MKNPQSSQPYHQKAKRLAFFVIALLFPFVFMILLEASLRLFGYGTDLSLFSKEQINGKMFLVMNQAVKGRYFSRVEFSPNTSPDYLQMPKPDSTFRIFCLGGSTTAGFPYGFVGSFSTYLRDRLHMLFPYKKIEVINLGMTATNSFTVLDVARELPGYQPDLVIVYDGHNEFYGALGIASHESFGPARWATQLYLRLIHFRTFQLLRSIFSSLAAMFGTHSAEQQSGTMMERLASGQYVPFDCDVYRHCLEIFKENVGELAELCRKNSIPLFLGSQVSNLRDLPPFVSVSEEDKSQPALDSLLLAGKRLSQHGSYVEALSIFEKGVALDSARADFQFEAAHCLDTLGRKREALARYIKARDYDMLRFRMSSDFNDVLRQMDDDNNLDGNKLVTFVDIERSFKDSSQDSLIGNNLILEHLHPNERGSFLIAKEFVSGMRRRELIVNRDDEWNKLNNLDEEKLWNERPLTELDKRAAQRRTQMLKSGWPFQIHSTPVPEVDLKDTIGVIAEQLVRGLVTWEEAHVTAADHYARRGDMGNVEREYKALVNQIPQNVSAYLSLGEVYIREHKNTEAASILMSSLDVQKTALACRQLATLAPDPKAAIEYLEDAFQLSSGRHEKTETGYLLADAYWRGNQKEKTMRQLEAVLVINPHFAPARDLLSHISSAKQ